MTKYEDSLIDKLEEALQGTRTPIEYARGWQLATRNAISIARQHLQAPSQEVVNKLLAEIERADKIGAQEDAWYRGMEDAISIIRQHQKPYCGDQQNGQQAPSQEVVKRIALQFLESIKSGLGGKSLEDTRQYIIYNGAIDITKLAEIAIAAMSGPDVADGREVFMIIEKWASFHGIGNLTDKANSNLVNQLKKYLRTTEPDDMADDVLWKGGYQAGYEQARREPKPVSVSLKKCINAIKPYVSQPDFMDAINREIIEGNARSAAKAILDAAGVKYVD